MARKGNRQSAVLAGPTYSPPMVENYSQRLAFENKAVRILGRQAFYSSLMQSSHGTGRPPMLASVRDASVANAQEVRGSQRWRQSRRSRQACYSFTGIDGRLLAAYRDSGRAARRAEKAASRAGRVLVISCDTFTPPQRERTAQRRAKVATAKVAQVHKLAHIVGTHDLTNS